MGCRRKQGGQSEACRLPWGLAREVQSGRRSHCLNKQTEKISKKNLDAWKIMPGKRERPGEIGSLKKGRSKRARRTSRLFQTRQKERGGRIGSRLSGTSHMHTRTASREFFYSPGKGVSSSNRGHQLVLEWRGGGRCQATRKWGSERRVMC